MQGQYAEINGSEGCPSQKAMRPSYNQLNHQHLYLSGGQDAGSNQEMFTERPDSEGFRTPPLVPFSNHGDVQNSYATVPQNYGSRPEEATPPWQDFHSSHQSSGNFGLWGSGVGSLGSGMQGIPPDPAGSPSSFGQNSMYSTVDSYGSSHTSYSRPSTLNCIDPELIQVGSPSKHPPPIAFTDAQQVSSPDQFTTAPSSPSSFDCQNASPDQDIGYPRFDQPGNYFNYNPSYPPYPVRRELQQLNSRPQSQAYPNPNNGDPVPSLPPHYRPTPHDEEQDTATDGTSQEPYFVCDDLECGQKFKRPTDLVRHWETAKKHGPPRGPLCPESGCKYTLRFSRTDNFKAHYKNKHKKTDEEADQFIKLWKDMGRP
ncbi:hypothetical protein L873DRAFT_1798687 [Choiromyces venosus 120613-1]|uniref:C2H2-type domain-containing protein n=1 Tax=Choiromyces venosus 120613-1 TaxID=1336337 RepID=A0A3N4K5R9_9PEZI|nr:hypothetical protein L873DRAFT_1798687 [Choiromyces venosus 120613-1]